MDYVLIDTPEPLESFGLRFRKLMNLPERNASRPIADQFREGVNHGGTYFHFECLGLHLELMRNSGDSAVCETNPSPLYVLIHNDSTDDVDGVVGAMVRHCVRVLNHAGIKAEVGT